MKNNTEKIDNKNPLAEVFGFPVSNASKEALRFRHNRLCPFNNKVPSCTKDKAKNPLGVCSIFNGGKPGEIDIYNIFNASAKGDRLALELMDDATNWFAIGMSNIILLYDPQTVVIQGIFSKAGKYFLDSLRKKINEISLPKIKKETRIEYSELGDRVGVLGATHYAISKYFEN